MTAKIGVLVEGVCEEHGVEWLNNGGGDEGALKSNAQLRKLSYSVEAQINNHLSNGIVTSGIQSFSALALVGCLTH